MKWTKKTLARHLGKISEETVTNPLIRRWVLDHGVIKDHGNTQPWHAQAERLSVIFQASTIVDHLPWVFEFDVPPEGFNALVDDYEEVERSAEYQNMLLRWQLIELLQEAQTYLWSDECLAIANEMPLPRHVITNEQIPHNVMFWSEQRAITLPNGAESNWIVIVNSHDCFLVFTDSVSTGGIRIGGFKVPNGKIYPDDFSDLHQTVVGNVLKSFAFLNSPYVSDEPRQLPRSIRRQIKRNGLQNNTTGNDLVTNHVVLRREIKHFSPNEEESGRNYRKQWWVSGHIRAQWYPSLNAHKLIWIAPYLKGPEGAPIKEKTYAVVR